MSDGPEDQDAPSPWERLAALPDIDDDPLEATWLSASRSDTVDEPPAIPIVAPSAPPHTDAPHASTTSEQHAVPEQEPRHDARHFHVRPGPVPDVDSRHDHVQEDMVASPPEPRPEKRRRRGRWIGGAVLVVVLALAGFGLYAWILWGQVDRVETAGALSPPSGAFTNYLIVGVDSREGVDANLDTAPQIGLGVEGSRSDTMVLLHVGSNGNRLLSLPRDLWVDVAGFGPAKLNAATVLGGPPTLIETVKGALGVPVHHYLEVDIAGFLSVIEAVGSISIEFPTPACDPKSGLDVRQTGNVALGAEQALAYVRSRTYTEFDAGSAAGLGCNAIRSAGLGREKGNADFGRTERQRRFLLAVFDKVSSTRNPVTILRVLSGLSDGLRVDDTMGMRDAFNLLQDLRGLNAESSPLPVSDFTAPDNSSALTLASDAQAVLDSVR